MTPERKPLTRYVGSGHDVWPEPVADPKSGLSEWADYEEAKALEAENAKMRDLLARALEAEEDCIDGPCWELALRKEIELALYGEE